ncbi:hypothetical protein B1207_10200 [Legionella quinlivanii]|uniref:Uncharacterized protein n=1 Tax=Legionella quinlivanii TaxID=45073 RepID=A0A364LHV8_9GAMM|nr:hypothetical protein [Legionella quinlivanii]RAP35942.1 hypothetical protein B1207_10200 [Legionella quinlivanii]
MSQFVGERQFNIFKKQLFYGKHNGLEGCSFSHCKILENIFSAQLVSSGDDLKSILLNTWSFTVFYELNFHELLVT